MSRQGIDTPVDESPTPSPPPNSPVRGQVPVNRLPADELSRAIQATGMASASSSTGNGLMRALEAATRNKGAKSGNSSQADQAKSNLPNMPKTGSYSRDGRDGSDGYSLGSLVPYKSGASKDASLSYRRGFSVLDGYSQQGGNHQYQANSIGNGPEGNTRSNSGQRADFSQQQSSHQQNFDTQNGPGYRNFPNPLSRPVNHTGSRLDRLVHETDRYLYRRLLTISQNLAKLPGMPPDVATVLSTELYHVYEDYAAQSRKLSSEYSETEAERDSLVREIAKSQGVASKYQRDSAEYRRLYHDTVASRDQATADKDRFKKQLRELANKQLVLEQRLAGIEGKHAISLKDLHKELQFKEDQIKAKRTLWMNAHGESSGNTVGSTRDSYGTPSIDRQMPSVTISGPAASSQQDWGPLVMSGSTFGSGAGYGRVGEQEDSPEMALVPFKADMEIVEEFSADFDNLYDVVLKWTQRFTRELKTIDSDQATSRSPQLWSFMKKCTYEDNDKEAHSHVIHLLRDAKARPFFLMRMIVQVLCNDIWTTSTFEDFEESAKPKFEYFRERLQTKGLSPEERAMVVCQQAELIDSMIQQNMRYLIYRKSQVTRHGKTLRARTGPLLDTGVRRSEAGDGLNDIALLAFDLSAKMFTSNRSFVIKFPDCGTKFMHTSMVSRNPYDAQAPLDNQLRQTRVKLAITPVVTMRDDRFRTIQVKDIQHSHVLIMI